MALVLKVYVLFSSASVNSVEVALVGEKEKLAHGKPLTSQVTSKCSKSFAADDHKRWSAELAKRHPSLESDELTHSSIAKAMSGGVVSGGGGGGGEAGGVEVDDAVWLC